MASALHVVQISDTHLFTEPTGKLLGLVTRDSFHAVLKAVKALDPAPDLILLTGDLAQDHLGTTYGELAKLLAPLQIPTYWLPGNHDDPVIMGQFLSQAPFSSLKQIEVGGWQLLLLDSHVPGHVHGALTPETLAGLETSLKNLGDQPVLVALHHPPFVVGSRWLDGSRLQNPEALFAVIQKFPQVRLVLFGHIHQEFHRTQQGITYLGSPSTCIQFQPRSQEFGLDPVGPGFRQVWLYPDGSWDTQVQRVDFVTLVDALATGY